MNFSTITRSEVTTTWAMWVEQGAGTHAVLMDSEDGSQVWVETDAATAALYADRNGTDRVRMIVENAPQIAQTDYRVSMTSRNLIRVSTGQRVSPTGIASLVAQGLWSEAEWALTSEGSQMLYKMGY